MAADVSLDRCVNVKGPLTKAVDQQISVDINYQNCKKAFDTVPHRRLLIKLKAYGIGGSLIKWVEDFLTNRQQIVEIRGE